MKEKSNNVSQNEAKQNKKSKLIYVVIILVIAILIETGILIYSKISENKNVNTIQNLDENCLNNYDEPVKKPIVYLYPTVETKLSVKLGYPSKVICSYPKYKSGWNVIAKPNGDLTDLETGRNLYSLYYESEPVNNFQVEREGFVVKGADADKFLEEKLALLGLTEREAEEFIVYWLPRLQENEYNYIRFATEEEINENMPLSFSVEPDTIIRVLMTFKGLDKPIDVKEQKIVTPDRTGFVAVEWGGIEIK